jgi:hypothetical protein
MSVDTGKPLAKYVPPQVFNEDMPANGIGRDSMGVRQVIEIGDETFVGTNAGIAVLDATKHVKSLVSNSLYVGGHALCRDPDGEDFWFNSTPTDSLVRINRRGQIKKVINLAQIKEVANPLGLTAWAHDVSERDYRAILERDCNAGKRANQWDQMHLNWIQFHDGAMYATACTQRAFVRVRPDPAIILRDMSLANPHDFVIVGDKIVVNDSGNRAVVIYNMDGERRGVIQLHGPGDGATSMSGWTRGMAILDNDNILVGTTPLGVLHIDIKKLRVVSDVRFTDDVRDSCHGLTLVREA